MLAHEGSKQSNEKKWKGSLRKWKSYPLNKYLVPTDQLTNRPTYLPIETPTRSLKSGSQIAQDGLILSNLRSYGISEPWTYSAVLPPPCRIKLIEANIHKASLGWNGLNRFKANLSSTKLRSKLYWAGAEFDNILVELMSLIFKTISWKIIFLKTLIVRAQCKALHLPLILKWKFINVL